MSSKSIYSLLRGVFVCRCGSGVEQGFRKAKVGGSNPSSGTIKKGDFMSPFLMVFAVERV